MPDRRRDDLLPAVSERRREKLLLAVPETICEELLLAVRVPGTIQYARICC